MVAVVKLKIRKELDGRQQLCVIKLKGNLILQGYTEIIHILDQDEDYHTNFFEIKAEKNNDVREFITTFINEENLEDTISFIN